MAGGGINDGDRPELGSGARRPAARAGELHRGGTPDVRLWNPQPNNVQNYFATARRRTYARRCRQERPRLVSRFRSAIGRHDGHHAARSIRRDSNGDVSAHCTVPRLALDALRVRARRRRTTMRRARASTRQSGFAVHAHGAAGRHRFAARSICGTRPASRSAGTTRGTTIRISRRLSTATTRSATTSAVARPHVCAPPWLDATAQRRRRLRPRRPTFSIGSGWMGGFPFYAGAGDFSKGGSEGDEISSGRSTGRSASTRRDLGRGTRLDVARARTFRTVQRALARRRLRRRTFRRPALRTRRRSRRLRPGTRDARHDMRVREAGTGVARRGSVQRHASEAWYAIAPAQHVVRAVSRRERSARLCARSSQPERRAGSSRALVATLRGGRTAPTRLRTRSGRCMRGARSTGSLAPVGTGCSRPTRASRPKSRPACRWTAAISRSARADRLGVTFYHEQTSGVILPVSDPTLGTSLARNAGRGDEPAASRRHANCARRRLRRVVLAGTRRERREELESGRSADFGGVGSLPLGPSQWGLRPGAAGQPLGVLMGLRCCETRRRGRSCCATGCRFPIP